MKFKTKREKIRSLTGFLLVLTLAFNAVFVFGSSFFVSDWLFPPSAKALEVNKNDFKNFKYAIESLDIFRRINLSSYLDKPVKIPLKNGKEDDLLIVHPPKILNKTASLPLRTTLLSSGSVPNGDNLKFAQDIENQINAIAENNQTLLEILRNLTERGLQVSVQNDEELIKLLIQKVQAEEGATGESLDTNPLLTEDSLSSLTGEALGEGNASSSQTRQLLVILLLLLYMNQALASSLNEEKTVCIESGGEWIGGKCFNENAEKCEENGGKWKLFKNACYVEKQICGNSNKDCSNYNGDPASSIWSQWSSNSNSNSNESDSQSVYGCACNSAKCLDEETLTCVPKENTKQNLCEKSGGEWREFSSAEELCLMHCGETNDNCSGATFNDNYNWESADGSAEARENCDCGKEKCLSPSGKCIKKSETDADDDKDGVTNKYDKCANTPQGETVNNIENDQNRGCSCNQLTAMGKVPRVYCPPDGCEGNYLVRYDRTMMNQPQCQNGVIQQQNNYNNYGNYGSNYNNYGSSYGSSDYYGSSYGNSGACPVVSRMQDSRCNNNNNQNDNNNKKLEDLLKDLLKNKNQNQNKNQGGDKGGGGGGGGGNPTGDPGTSNPKPDPKDDKDKPKKTPTGNDPEGVGQFNKDRDGSTAKPYLLHATQFTKVCGKNEYILTNAKPREGKLRDKPEDKSNQPGTNQQTPSPIAHGDAKFVNDINKIIQSTDWSNVTDKSKIAEINKILEPFRSQTGANLNQSIVDKINNLIKQGQQQATQTPATPPITPTLLEYDSMKDVQGEPVYKVPTCQELASAHCCVCSACNQTCCDDVKCKNSQKDCEANCKQEHCCGWAVGKDCAKEGKGECKGDKCTSCSNLLTPCKEDAGKSIKLKFDEKDPFQGWNIANDKETTSVIKCEDFNKDLKNKTHESICRYDCRGEITGCEGGYDDCKISVVSDGDHVKHTEPQDANKFEDGKPANGKTTFTNRKEGSLIKVEGANMGGVKAGWVKKLSDNKGKACNCQ